MTYELDGRRYVLPAIAENLERTAEIWTAALVREWFGRNLSMRFFHVPQVAVYPDGPIPVRAEWLDPPTRAPGEGVDTFPPEA